MLALEYKDLRIGTSTTRVPILVKYNNISSKVLIFDDQFEIIEIIAFFSVAGVGLPM